MTFSSSKRPGETPESGSIKERKKEDGAVGEGGHVVAPRNPTNQVTLANYGLLEADEDELRLALVPEDIQNAIDFPTAGWPTYQALYGCDPPIPLFKEQSQIAGLEGLGPTTTQNRGAGQDKVSRALERAGAQRVASAEWL